MKKFFFSLYTVLNVKELEKEKKVNELTIIKNNLLSLQDERDKLIKIVEVEKQFFSTSMKIYSVNDLILNKEYIESIFKKIEVINIEIGKLSFKKKNVTDEVIKFTKEINVLYKIKEAKKLEYNAMLQAEEEKKLQEMVQTKYIHKKK